eukprot:scaffold88042_cov43-Tisochrysis_lutea.AAC.4
MSSNLSSSFSISYSRGGRPFRGTRSVALIAHSQDRVQSQESVKSNSNRGRDGHCADSIPVCALEVSPAMLSASCAHVC